MAEPPREQPDRRRYPNRRTGVDRRHHDVPVEVDRRKGNRRKDDRRSWQERRDGDEKKDGSG